MLNYIHAELYKATHRVYTWIMLGLIFLGEGFLFTIWFDQRDYTTFFNAVSIVGSMMILGFFATLFTCDIVFAGQHQNGTLKNEVSFGLSRTKIYLGKFIAMTILSVLAMVIALGVYLAVCRVMLPDYVADAVYYEGGGALAALEIVGVGVLTELPVWLGCQAIICAASFLLNSAIVANVVALGVVMGSRFILYISILFMREDNPLVPLLAKIYSWLPYEILNAAYPGVGRLINDDPAPTIAISWEMVARGWIIGGFWLIFATAVGLYLFHKKEVK